MSTFSLLPKIVKTFPTTSSGQTLQNLLSDHLTTQDTKENSLNPTPRIVHKLTPLFNSLDKNDPTIGFCYDATTIAGHSFPNTTPQDDQRQPDIPSLFSNRNTQPQFSSSQDDLTTRLLLGSHIAQYLRLSLEETQGYTSTVGISTNKLLSKLVGNVNKPKGQTTLLPPYSPSQDQQSNIFHFLDPHDISQIPGIGCSIARKLRSYLSSQVASTSLPNSNAGQHPEPLLLSTVRTLPTLSPQLLENLLGGPGSHRGIGGKICNLIHGMDDTEVRYKREVPRQISIEDSYVKLDTLEQVRKELFVLTTTLLKRMRVDLLADDNEDGEGERWLAYPKTIRLSTRPRPPSNHDGSRGSRTFTRISRSAPLPSYIFNTKDALDTIVEKLVVATLIPMFKHLHPEKKGWDLSLVNVAVLNMEETTTSKGKGPDIKSLWAKGKEKREWDVEDRDVPPSPPSPPPRFDGGGEMEIDEVKQEIDPSNRYEEYQGSEDHLPLTQNSDEGWYDSNEDPDDESSGTQPCRICGLMLPVFAMDAHERWHTLDE
jgi:DNA polymerase iota